MCHTTVRPSTTLCSWGQAALRLWGLEHSCIAPLVASCWKIIKSGAKRSHESQHCEVTRFHDYTRLDLADGRHSYSGTRRELFLGQACLLAEGTKPGCQSFGLFAEAAFSASSPSSTDHGASLK